MSRYGYAIDDNESVANDDEVVMSKYSYAPEDEPVVNNGGVRFLVFGLGGGGGNAVQHMVDEGVQNVNFVCANTDGQALGKLTVPKLIQLGAKENRGLGAGGDPKVGRTAAESDEEQIRQVLQGFDMVFITAGMGGGTGTGSAPVVARIAKEMGILTVAVVTTPFVHEGARRMQIAKAGVDALSEHVDCIITIPNSKLIEIYGKLPIKDSMKLADDVLKNAVNGLVQTIVTSGRINTDFNDIRTAMTARGHAIMGVGTAGGEGRATRATENAIHSPLLANLRLENAKGLLVNITCAELMTHELEEIAEAVNPIVDIQNGNIFYGIVEDENMGDEINITIIATGLTLDEQSDEPPKPVQAKPQELPRDARQPQYAPFGSSTPSPEPQRKTTVADVLQQGKNVGLHN